MANGGGTDGRTHGRTDGRTDVWKFPLCSTGHWPFGAAAQKGKRDTRGLNRLSQTSCERKTTR